MKVRRWTEAEERLVEELYPDTTTREIAERLGRTVRAVYTRAKAMDLHKSEAFLNTKASGRYSPGHNRSHGSRFTKGHTPWNAGRKGYDAGGRSHQTRFGEGHRPHNEVPIGTEVVHKGGYLKRKIRDDAPVGYARRNWAFVHHLVWQDHHGPIPPNHVVIFIDGDKRNFAIENLALVHRRDLMKRNTIHRYPKELGDAIRQNAGLKRRIRNMEKRAHEKQD